MRADACRCSITSRASIAIAAVFFDETDTLGIVTVGPGTAPTATPAAAAFDRLRENASVSRDIERYRSRIAAPPDYTLQLTLDTAQTLPFELWQVLRNEVWPGSPVEWTGTMPMMDWLATSRQLRWVLRDSATRRENMNVAWRFHAGDLVRIRLVNDARILHPMQHPIHIHGQRFLVVAVDGDPMHKSLMEGHGAGPGRIDGRSARRDDESRHMDAALPHRRTHGERHAHDVRRRP